MMTTYARAIEKAEAVKWSGVLGELPGAPVLDQRKLVSTAFRIWGLARASLLRSWAAERLRHPRWNNLSCRRPGDIVWRDMLKAKHSGSSGLITAAALLNIFKMIDQVHHDTL
jgi:hypothetical protein